MQKVHSESDLKNAIAYLENKQNEERVALSKQFNMTYESIKPVNLLKNTLKDVTSSLEIKESFLVTAVGIATGYFSKRIFFNRSLSPMKKIIGAALLFGATNVIARHPEKVKLIGRLAIKMIGRIFSKNYKAGKS